jgi:fructose-bisphosphate aldolase class II
MEITLKELLKSAQEKQIAYASFNAPNYESAKAVVLAAEELQIPFILSHGPGHDCYTDIEHIMDIYRSLTKNLTVDHCFHLDHTSDLSYIEKALKLGFTSVMYDGSHESYEDNVANTIKVVTMAKRYGAAVEAELGTVASSSYGKSETLKTVSEGEYTDPLQAKDFVDRTGIDFLAIAVGTVHGIYVTKPVLDLNRIKLIKDVVDIPLVLHGGSGIGDEDILIAIKNGIRKINYYTYMTLAGGDAVKKHIATQDKIFFHDISLVAIEGMKQDAKRTMKLFSVR